MASWSAAIWLFAASANFVLTYLSASGSEVSYGSQFSEGLWLFATQIELGTLLAFNLGFAFVLSLSTIALGGRTDDSRQCSSCNSRSISACRVWPRLLRLLATHLRLILC